MEAVPGDGRPGGDARPQGPGAGGGVRAGGGAGLSEPLAYVAPGPEHAESLLLQAAIAFDGYRSFAPPGWEPPDQLTPELVERARAGLADPDGFALMAVYGEDPVAHVLWVPARDSNEEGAPLIGGLFHLRALFVLEPWWGKGVASTLHARALAAARERGWREGRLYTPSGQARARRFYEREGWRAVEERDDEKLGMPIVEYRLHLG